jgi:hypothetical protein
MQKTKYCKFNLHEMLRVEKSTEREKAQLWILGLWIGASLTVLQLNGVFEMTEASKTQLC